MMHSSRLFSIAALVILSISAPTTARAQSGLTIWAGIGGSSQNGKAQFGKDVKQLGAQFGLPIIPVAVRADALLFGSTFDTDAVSYMVSGVVQMRLPVVQPYLILGQGRYAVTPTTRATGWNVGVGVHVGPQRFGVFGEVRRHDAVGRTVTTLGVTF